MDWEIAHINISLQSEEQKTKALQSIAEKVSREADEGVAGCPYEDEKPIVDWHTDSYPFVCVTMLSDCREMVGGETALRKGNGDIVKVRGPQMVSSPSSSQVQVASLLTRNRDLLSSCRAAISNTRHSVRSVQRNASAW